MMPTQHGWDAGESKRRKRSDAAKDFADALWQRRLGAWAELARRFPAELQRSARRKLLALHAATELRQMAVPPGNRLEALKGKRKGEHSVRVNDQWRICFRWREGNACDVEITDYH